VSEEEYIAIVGEIFDGYTEFYFKGEPVYLKHFSIRDQRYIHKYYNKYKNLAINKGIQTEEEALNNLKKDGLWSKDDDYKISSIEMELENLKDSLLNIILPSQKKALQETIDERQKELNILKIKRKEVVGTTAEDFASSRSNEEFIRYILFKDQDLKEHLFTEEEFGELDDKDIISLVKQNSNCSNRLSEELIQESVLRDFFNMYLSQTEDVSSFYGKPIIYLSVYQLKLALYAKVFYNIFQYNDDIPNTIKKDPSALLRFAESKRSGGNNKVLSKIKDNDSGATTLFGATKDDLQEIIPDAPTISLSDHIKNSGGTLSMEDMIKLMGE
jgi:hypothetical protein